MLYFQTELFFRIYKHKNCKKLLLEYLTAIKKSHLWDVKQLNLEANLEKQTLKITKEQKLAM